MVKEQSKEFIKDWFPAAGSNNMCVRQTCRASSRTDRRADKVLVEREWSLKDKERTQTWQTKAGYCFRTGNSVGARYEVWARLKAMLLSLIPRVLKSRAQPARVKVMAEAGATSARSGQRLLTNSRICSLFCRDRVTLNETCPMWLGGKRKSSMQGDDPPALAKGAATEEEALAHYRRVRDEIRDFVDTSLSSMLCD